MIHCHIMGEFVAERYGVTKPLPAKAQAVLDALRQGPRYERNLRREIAYDSWENISKQLRRRGIRTWDAQTHGGTCLWLVSEPGQHRHCPDCGCALSAYNPGFFCACCHVRRVIADEPIHPPLPDLGNPFCRGPRRVLWENLHADSECAIPEDTVWSTWKDALGAVREALLDSGYTVSRADTTVYLIPEDV